MLLANHGPVVSGKTLTDAVYAAEELEEAAKLYLMLRHAAPRLLTRRRSKNCCSKRQPLLRDGNRNLSRVAGEVDG